MPLNEEIVKKIKGEATDSLDTLNINDPSFSYQDLSELSEIFPQNSSIHKIFIATNSLTTDSYRLLFEFIKKNKNITASSVKIPVSMKGTILNQAIKTILDERDSTNNQTSKNSLIDMTESTKRPSIKRH